MFTDKERKIFRYSDGTQDVCADPQVVLRALQAEAGNDLGGLLDRVGSKIDDVTNAAMIEFLAAIRVAFDVKPLARDGSGLLEEEMVELFDQFSSFLEKKSEPAVNSPTSSPPIPESASPPTA